MDDKVISQIGPITAWPVHFYPGEMDVEEMPGTYPRAAIITKVVNEGVVNLVVFDGDGAFRTFPGVLYDKKKSNGRRWCYISDTFKAELNG